MGGFDPRKVLYASLQAMNDRNGSDIYVTCQAPILLRNSVGDLEQLTDYPLDEKMVSDIINVVTTSEQQSAFGRDKELNTSLALPLGRYRVNMFRQRRQSAMVLRRILTEIPRFDDLGLPTVLGDLICEKRGLIIVVGATGSGKSTSLASMIDFRNRASNGHILTIEDPVEYVHQHKKCIVSQREVGTDTMSFDAALKNSLRQRPDVILIGEIRDASVMRHAMNISETGHLALATLHANNADQAIERISNFFDLEERRQVLLNLSFNLKGILSQRLVRTTDNARTAALEIMLVNERIRELVRDGDTKSLKAEIAAGRDVGMQTFDQHLAELYKEGRITEDVALAEADNRETLRQYLIA